MASGQVHAPAAARQPRPPGVILAGAMPGDAGAAAPVPPPVRGGPP